MVKPQSSLERLEEALMRQSAIVDDVGKLAQSIAARLGIAMPGKEIGAPLDADPLNRIVHNASMADYITVNLRHTITVLTIVDTQL